MQKHLDPQYVDKCLRTGQFIEISSPRPKPLDSPKRLKQRHGDIEHQALAACELAGTTDGIPVAAFDTQERLMIVEIQPPQAPLREQPQMDVYARQTFAAKRGKERAAHLNACATQLNAGLFTTYAGLREFCGGDEDVVRDLRAIHRLTGSDVSVQTVEGVTELCLDKILQISLPGDKQVKCTTSFYGMHTNGGEIVLALRLDANLVSTVLHVSGRPVRTVRLATQNKLRALKILQAAAFLDEEVDVVIGSAFRLSVQKWELVMHGFADETSTLKLLSSLASLIPD